MRPVVAVIGTTGVGKSQLAVSLAQSLERSGRTAEGPLGLNSSRSLRPTRDTRAGPSRGIVLSADSMQLYKGLDVITNKVTLEEQGGVEHWGLDMVQPGQGGSWELGRWCTEADSVVDGLPESTLPIICGGTHYFIQHFLFPPPELSTSRLGQAGSSKSGGSKGKESAKLKSSSVRWSPPCAHPPTPDLDAASSRLLETFWTHHPVWPGPGEAPLPDGEKAASGSMGLTGAATWTDAQLLSLHRLLAAVDPAEAGRWHWRDGRKVKRGLERWWERGGAVQADQTTTKRPGDAPRKASFRTLIFWVYESMDILRPRLDKRVDKMVQNGLLREIAELRGIAQDIYGSAESADHTEGIFQAIGYKEFTHLPLDIPDPTTHPGFPAMLDRMKLSTHQYAKSQLSWIRKQLLPAVREARAGGQGDVWVYVVPGGEANEKITQEILSAFLAGGCMPDPRSTEHAASAELLSLLDESEGEGGVPDIAGRQSLNARKDCDVCSSHTAPYSVMLKDWDTHVKSKLHKRNVLDVTGGRQALIEREKLAGLAKKAERERVKASLSQPGDSGSRADA